MKLSKMLHQMCHDVLTGVDIKALCKARGLPPEAAASRGILETLFLSPQGLSNVFDALDSNEIAALHLLKSVGTPVDVTFFARVYGGKSSGGTFTQRFQKCFAQVKQRLVRSGLILLAETPQGAWQKNSKLERWRFALPAEFYSHLPPLINSPRQFEGDGDWRSDVVREKLSVDLSSRKHAGNLVVFRIEAGELRLHGKPFRTAALALWQQTSWKEAIRIGKKSGPKQPHSKRPVEAVLCILSELASGHWAATEQLIGPLRVFCEQTIDAQSLCDVGWEWGLLARRRADGTNWYRLAPKQHPVAPHQYLAVVEQSGYATVDLTTIPFDVLEQIVAISDQRVGDRDSTLLLAPNFVKLGRASDELLTSEAVQWLVEQTPAFAEAYVNLCERRGKTILHESLCVARISDLSLKVSIEKALGDKLVSLKNDFVAFPHGFLDDVRRVVNKSGHVIKEVAAK